MHCFLFLTDSIRISICFSSRFKYNSSVESKIFFAPHIHTLTLFALDPFTSSQPFLLWTPHNCCNFADALTQVSVFYSSAFHRLSQIPQLPIIPTSYASTLTSTYSLAYLTFQKGQSKKDNGCYALHQSILMLCINSHPVCSVFNRCFVFFSALLTNCVPVGVFFISLSSTLTGSISRCVYPIKELCLLDPICKIIYRI